MTRPIVYVEDTRPQLLFGSGAPASELGEDGDAYLDVANAWLYGPKTAGAWGAGIGLQGEQGEQGEQGQTGESGSTAAVQTGTMRAYAGLEEPTGYLWCDGGSHLRADYDDLFQELTQSKGTFTITIANPGVVTLASHGLVPGDAVYLTTTGVLPTGLAVDTTYYVRTVTTNTFQLAATRGGAAINTTVGQSGTHTLHRAPWGGVTSTHFAVPDLRGRAPVGLDNMGGSAAGRMSLVEDVLGNGGGAETHTLTEAEMPSHNHTQAAHTHTQALGGGLSNVPSSPGTNVVGNANTSVTTSATPVINDTGLDSPHNNMPPYVFVNWIIKT